MFGLEKQPKQPFQFDLEADLHKDPAKAKALLKDIEQRMAELKKLLREGAETDDFDEYGVLLHAYTAFQRVLKRITEKK